MLQLQQRRHISHYSHGRRGQCCTLINVFCDCMYAAQHMVTVGADGSGGLRHAAVGAEVSWGGDGALTATVTHIRIVEYQGICLFVCV